MIWIGSTWADRRERGYPRFPPCTFVFQKPRRPWEQPPLVNPDRTYACRHPASFEHDGKLYCNAHAKIVALRVLIDPKEPL